MEFDFLDLYTRASAWALALVPGATSKLDAPTTCEPWTVRTLLNHMLYVQGAFVAHARGEGFSLTLEDDPPDVLGDDPYADFERARAEALRVFGAPGVIEETGTNLGNVFGDQLLHGWDLAVSTGQDSTMPQGLPEAAYALVYGAFTEEGRKGVLKPEVDVAADASAQDRLLAYSGRDPSRVA